MSEHHWWRWLTPGILPEERAELRPEETPRTIGDVAEQRPLRPVRGEEDYW